jgi:hypothetical protein
MNYRARYTQLKRLKLLDEWTFTPPPVHLLWASKLNSQF